MFGEMFTSNKQPPTLFSERSFTVQTTLIKRTKHENEVKNTKPCFLDLKIQFRYLKRDINKDNKTNFQERVDVYLISKKLENTRVINVN